MDLRTVLEVIPRYHPVYSEVPAEVIAEVDDRYAHGTFRNWASFTHSVLAHARGTPHGAYRPRPARTPRGQLGTRSVTGQRRLITEAAQDREQIRRLYTRAHEHDHVLCLVPTPGRRGEGIGRDLLRALGKRFDRPRTPRDPQRLLELAGIWLNAHGITTVIVRHADRLSIESWREICSVLPAYTDLWLWAEPFTLTPAHQRVSRELDMNTGSLEALQSRLASNQSRQHQVARLAEQTPTPIAPDADYALFAIASQAPGNETLFANFLLGRDHALWHLNKIERRPDEASVNRLLAHVAHCAADDEAAIARARGAQMQLLLAGIHTSIDPEPLRGLITAHNLSRPDRHAARLLSGYVQPIPAATAAACLASGRGPTIYTVITGRRDERYWGALGVDIATYDDELMPSRRLETAIDNFQLQQLH
jgi:hypothetical protein